MNKKYGLMFGLFILLLISCPFCVKAAEQQLVVTDIEGEGDEGQAQNLSKVEAAKDSVVQVVIHYVDEDGNKYLLKSGSGFLINESVVLSNYQNVVLTDEEKAIASQYVSAKTGKESNFGDGEGNQVSYQIGVVVYRDVVFNATINEYSSKEMDLAILNVDGALNRATAMLGNSDEIADGEEIYALGYKEVSTMSSGETELLSQEDCKIEVGLLDSMIREAQIKYYLHTCPVNKGNTGGPLVDGNGNVIGMNTYQAQEEGIENAFKSLTINEVKGLLDSCEIAYQETGLFSVEEEYVEEPKQEEQKQEVDTNLLDNYIVNFNMLEQSDYTPESFRALQNALQMAKELKQDEEVTQEEIDDAVTQLEIAKNGLVLATKYNWPFIIVTAVLVLVIVTALILYILYLKGIIGNKTETESLQTLQEMYDKSKESLNGQSGSIGFQNGRSSNLNITTNRRAIVRPTENRANEGNQENGTTVLNTIYNSEQEEGTMVLGVAGNSRSRAYLTRVRTSEKIVIDRNEFIIGKGFADTHYCIRDNETVSRMHAKIVYNTGRYYLVDLHSTNATYLAGKPLHPEEEAELSNGSLLRLSDEEFIFHEM